MKLKDLSTPADICGTCLNFIYPFSLNLVVFSKFFKVSKLARLDIFSLAHFKFIFAGQPRKCKGCKKNLFDFDDSKLYLVSMNLGFSSENNKDSLQFQ